MTTGYLIDLLPNRETAQAKRRRHCSHVWVRCGFCCLTILHIISIIFHMLMTTSSTSLGKISGVEEQGVLAFRGVPYGQPADAEHRFRAARPLQPWQGVLACDHYAKAAWQESNALLGITEQSLDCLRMNIWAPTTPGPHPVMVWFHGGGFIAGSASQLLYNGRHLAQSQQVVVVNVGYRLGALGFGDFRSHLPDAETNLGLRDQISALEWVNAEIANFGGDADQITIFGESAGGFSVACLLACDRALPLFKRAIVQSGAADMVLSSNEVKRISNAFVAELGGADQLLSADQQHWVKAQRASYRMTVERGLRSNTPQYGMCWLPQIDGDLLTDLPLRRIANGSAKDKLLLAGVCRDEWNLFQYALPFNGNKSVAELRDTDVATVKRRFARALPETAQADAAFSLYSNEAFNTERGRLDWYAAMETDRLFIAPTDALLNAQAAAGGSAYGYLFAHEISLMGVPMGCCHVVDVPFVFGSVNSPVGQFFTGGGKVAEELSVEVQSIWGDLAYGRPLNWAPWSATQQARVFGSTETMMLPLLTADKRLFWDQVFNEVL